MVMLKEIVERFSVRKFADKPIPEKVLKEILEAGRLAPSWVNTQPWHFIVVKNDRNKTLLSQLAHGQPHVEAAPVVIVCCGDKSAWESGNLKNTMLQRGIPNEKIEALLKSSSFNPVLLGESAVNTRTLEGITYAIAYITLEAEAQGIGSCVIGNIGNDLTGSVPEVYELTKKTLELPENISIMALLTLGYPDESVSKPTKSRKTFDEVVSFETYGG